MRYNILQYDRSGRETLRSFLNGRVTTEKEEDRLSQAEADDIFSAVEMVYSICSGLSGRYESFDNWSMQEIRMETSYNTAQGEKRAKPIHVPVFSVIKKNGDYEMNLDFSLLCKKRETLDAVLQVLVDEGVFDQTNLERLDIAKINDIIRKHGFETACSLCFVDARRYRVGEVAGTFADLWNALVDMPDAELRKMQQMTNQQLKDYMHEKGVLDKPVKVEKDRRNKSSKDSVENKICRYFFDHPEEQIKRHAKEFITADGFDWIRTNFPSVFSFYNMKKGTGGPKASSKNTPYNNDILATKWNRTKAFNVGGVRAQSFSDFQGRMVFGDVAGLIEAALREDNELVAQRNAMVKPMAEEVKEMYRNEGRLRFRVPRDIIEVAREAAGVTRFRDNSEWSENKKNSRQRTAESHQ